MAPRTVRGHVGVPDRRPWRTSGDAVRAARELAAAVRAGWCPSPADIEAFFRARDVSPNDAKAAFARLTGATPHGLARIVERLKRTRALPSPPEPPTRAVAPRSWGTVPEPEREPDAGPMPVWPKHAF